MEWKKYGDVNPLEHGGLWVAHDTEIEGRCYYVIGLNPIDGENKWRFIDGYIDLDDTWIDWNEVRVSMDTPTNASDEMLAVDCYHYYGNQIGDESLLDNRGAIINELVRLGITSYDMKEIQ